MPNGYVSVFESTSEEATAEFLKKRGIKDLLATNGVYDRDRHVVLPSTIAATQYVIDQSDVSPDAALMIALNSDISLRNQMQANGATEEEIEKKDRQKTRAMKLWPGLQRQYPDRAIVIAFYDKSDPHDLYKTIAEGGFTAIDVLYKYGYGVPEKEGADAQVIIGAEFARKVYAFPRPKATADIHSDFWDVTPKGSNKTYLVRDLTVERGPHGAPYLTPDNKLLMPVVPFLEQFRATAAPRVITPRQAKRSGPPMA